MHAQWSTGLTNFYHIQFISTYPYTYTALWLIHINYIFKLFTQYYFIRDVHIVFTSLAKQS